jgi:hypothetical protein
MKKQLVETYETEDGRVFTDEKEAKKWEETLEQEKATTSYWSITHAPDLTEGRGYYGLTRVKVIRALWNEHLFKGMLEDWCYKKFGPKVAFIQGVAPMQSWFLSEIDVKEYNDKNATASCGDNRIKATSIVIAFDREAFVEVT